MTTSHLPAPLIPGPNQQPGQVVAVVLNPREAYLGWCGYTVSPPAPQDLWYPVMAIIGRYGITFEDGDSFMERQLVRPRPFTGEQLRKEQFRMLSYQSVLYQADLAQHVIDEYHQIRERLWPNSAAPSA